MSLTFSSINTIPRNGVISDFVPSLRLMRKIVVESMT